MPSAYLLAGQAVAGADSCTSSEGVCDFIRESPTGWYSTEQKEVPADVYVEVEILDRPTVIQEYTFFGDSDPTALYCEGCGGNEVCVDADACEEVDDVFSCHFLVGCEPCGHGCEECQWTSNSVDC